MSLSSKNQTARGVLQTGRHSVIQYYAGLKPSPIILWICTLLLVLYPFSLYLSVRGSVDLSENILNRILILLIGTFGLLNATGIVRYYFRNLVLADWLFLLFSCFYFYGINDVDMQTYSRYGRLVIWFYIVPFYLRRASRLVMPNFNTVLVCTLFLIITAGYMNIGYLHYSPRLNLGGGYTSTARFYLCIVGICSIALSNDHIFFVKRLFFILIMTAATVIALLSGSRQALVGLVLLMVLPYMFNLKGNEVFSIKSISIFLLVVAAVVLTITGIELFDVQRTLIFSYDSFLGRTERYHYFLSTIAGELPNSLIKGIKFFGDGRIQYGGIWIDLAPHNVYLNYATSSGVMSSLLLLLFHLYCFGSILYNYRRLKEWCAFKYIVAFVITIFLIAQFENFLYFVSSIEAYLLYAGMGFFVNILRDQKRLKISGGGRYVNGSR